MSERETVPAFRVGGVYRLSDGAVVKLETTSAYEAGGEARSGFAYANNVNKRQCICEVHLATGHSTLGMCRLIPGELEFVDGSWTARGAEEAPKPLGELLRNLRVPATPTPTLDKLANTTERIRPTLDYFYDQQEAVIKARDRFPGFKVSPGSGERNERSSGHFANHSSPDMNTSHQVAPMWGSVDQLPKR